MLHTSFNADPEGNLTGGNQLRVNQMRDGKIDVAISAKVQCTPGWVVIAKDDCRTASAQIGVGAGDMQRIHGG